MNKSHSHNDDVGMFVVPTRLFLLTFSLLRPFCRNAFRVHLEHQIGREKDDEVAHPNPVPLFPRVICHEDVDDDGGEKGCETVEERVHAHYEVIVLAGKSSCDWVTYSKTHAAYMAEDLKKPPQLKPMMEQESTSMKRPRYGSEVGIRANARNVKLIPASARLLKILTEVWGVQHLNLSAE